MEIGSDKWLGGKKKCIDRRRRQKKDNHEGLIGNEDLEQETEQ